MMMMMMVVVVMVVVMAPVSVTSGVFGGTRGRHWFGTRRRGRTSGRWHRRPGRVGSVDRRGDKAC